MTTREFGCSRILLVAIFFALINGDLLAASPVNQVFLVQNSGWMLPFYDDPNSKLRELVAELSDRVRPYGDGEQVLASFNQSYGENKSPTLIYKGTNAKQLRSAVQKIEVARKPGKTSYADTDFKEAIVGAITRFTPGQPALLWIVTNNKNSPDNSAETVEKNKEFYRFLQNTREIKRIIAFPLAMKVKSRSKADYRANGLMIYALAYGDPAEQVLLKMLAANHPFGQQSARLKPLSSEALTFAPRAVKGEGVTATLPDKKTLVLTFEASNKPEVAEITGQEPVRNFVFEA